MTQPTLRIVPMPLFRPADYCLGYFDDSVFIDFDNFEDDKVRLIRISFDGYGCCALGDLSIPLSSEDSKFFKAQIQNDINDQDMLLGIVKKALAINKDLVWEDV